MATVTGASKVRDNLHVSSATIVQTFNSIHALMLQSGMIKVADDEFAGQAGIYSTNGAVGTTLVNAATSKTTNGWDTIGYNVYRHPQLGFYIQIRAEHYLGKSAYSFCAPFYWIGTKLSDGGFDSTKQARYIRSYSFERISSQSSLSYSDLSLETLPITISCGPDHFWIARKGGYGTNQSTTLSNASFPNKTLDFFSLGVFASLKDPSILLVVEPQSAYEISGSNGLVGQRYYATEEIPAIVYQSFDGSVWRAEHNGCAGFLNDPSKSNTKKGIRVTQAEVIINGEDHRFNFGFLSNGVVSEFSEFSLNLIGVEGAYKSIPSLGSAGPSFPMWKPGDQSTVVFPVVSS